MSNSYQATADVHVDEAGTGLLLNSPEPSSTRKRNVCGCKFSNTLLGACCCLIMVSAALLVTVILLTRSSGSDNGGGGINPSPLQLEAKFRSSLDGSSIGVHLKDLTARAHIAGSEANYDTAVYVRDRMLSFGIPSVELQPFDVLLTYPTTNRSLQVIDKVGGAVVYNASLVERNYSSDPSTFLDAPATFLAYSANGHVEAEVVYCNYGQESDFQFLQSIGINITGKIALTRYGQVFRGNKVANAQQYGAIGILIYSDPADNEKGTPYPDGPWGTQWTAQRGSIWNGNGDPQTPGFPSTPYAYRLTEQEYMGNSETYNTPLPGIPALPISWGDAEPILRRIQGQSIPSSQTKNWQGGLNFTYMIGPGPVVANLNVFLNYTVQRIYNVIGKINGVMEEDRIVMLGNHRDAWTFGGADPNSGTATLLEVAKGFGMLLQTGWRPSRTIMMINWDAEEYATTGSVEMAESNEFHLSSKMVTYLNVDIAVTSPNGMLDIMGTVSLSNVTRAVASSIPVPNNPNVPASAKTLYDLWMRASNNSNILDGSGMGTGSDFGAFMQHLGVACMDLRFSGGPNDGYSGIYHTLYDDDRYMSEFADPASQNYTWMTTTAGLWGSMALRIADAQILPFSYVEYSVYMQRSLWTLQQLDTHSTYSNQFRLLNSSLTKLVDTANQLDMLVTDPQVISILTTVDNAATGIRRRSVNDQLYLAERCLLYWQGIVGREWYRHVVWVDDLYDGYASSAFSALSDALHTNQGVPQAIAMTNLVIENLNTCLTPNDWLIQLQQQQNSTVSAAPSRATLLTPEEIRVRHPSDRDFQFPTEHSKVPDTNTRAFIRKTKELI